MTSRRDALLSSFDAAAEAIRQGFSPSPTAQQTAGLGQRRQSDSANQLASRLQSGLNGLSLGLNVSCLSITCAV